MISGHPSKSRTQVGWGNEVISLWQHSAENSATSSEGKIGEAQDSYQVQQMSFHVGGNSGYHSPEAFLGSGEPLTKDNNHLT